MGSDVTLWLALGAGIISFFSPCTLPIFPAYLSYITGMSVKEIQSEKSLKVRRKLLFHSIFFLLGISLIFISLGLGATMLGSLMKGLFIGSTGDFLQRIAGIFIIVMGLFIGGWINFKWLMREKRMSVKPKTTLGYAGTVFVGMGFAAGWTPCIGPIFASILVLAANEPAKGLLYTITYVVGFAIPFLLFTWFIGSTRVILRYSHIIMKVGGSLMIVMGALLYTGQLTRLSNILLRLVQDTWFSNVGSILFS
ncbi:cytochrome c biogenesis CcdA family protein [Halobacillus sp. BBL2006]|uniref:cytochrome c biogenesis CcdA family protein n=1 Tax=Halobacillus sp. BBL2006 TaxID=1543706 RepID=UPI0005431BD1|nr:cytochrome c biogenesis protein CcdA [Halobacillus sp. BBL2006]KHE71329.1 cytochrome C biogenesis protein CcdA [Halobacillus sp. BBL2006]